MALNTGNAFRAVDELPQALGYYVNSAQMASSSGNSTLLFPALINIAEINYTLKVHDNALSALELAKQLILSQPSSEAYQIALRLQESVTEIYHQLLLLEKEKKTQQPAIQPLFEDLKKHLLSALVQYTVGATVYKLFGVRGAFVVSIFGSASNVVDNVFSRDAKVIIGKDNIQN